MTVDPEDLEPADTKAPEQDPEAGDPPPDAGPHDLGGEAQPLDLDEDPER